MENANKLPIINFHIHNIDSLSVDAHANATPEQALAYINMNSDKNNTKNCIVFANHNTFLWNNEPLTLKKFNEIKNKYSNTYIGLGSECNVTLKSATDDIFDQAHLLCYANMSTDKTISQWITSQDLIALSKLKTYKLTTRQFDTTKTFIQINAFLRKICKINLSYKQLLEISEKRYKSVYEFKSTLENKLIPELKKTKLFEGCNSDEEVKKMLYDMKIYNTEEICKISILDKLNPNSYEPLEIKLNKYIEQVNKYLKKFPIKQEEFELLKNYNNEELTSKALNAVAKHLLYEIPYLENMLSETFKRVNGVKKEKDKIDFIKNTILNTVLDKKVSTYNELFVEQEFQEYLGKKLYYAKNAINNHFNVRLDNKIIANILESGNSRETIINDFYKYACLILQENGIYKYSKNLPIQKQIVQLALQPLEYFGESITLNDIFDKSSKNGSKFNRINIAHLSEQVKNAGGFICLAHPDSVFRLTKNKQIDAKYFQNLDLSSLSLNKQNDLLKKLKMEHSMNTDELRGNEYFVLRLELFNKILKNNNIHLDAIEISKGLIKFPTRLLNVLIFCAKNNLEVSYGNDLHISKKSYLFRTLKPASFAVEESKLRKQKDFTSKEDYSKFYEQTFKTNLKIENKHKLEHGILKSDKIVKLIKEPTNYTVNDTSLFELTSTGKKNMSDDKILFQMKYDNDDNRLTFRQGYLKKLEYIKSFDENTKELSVDSEMIM